MPLLLITVWIASFGLVAAGLLLLIRGIKQIIKFVGGPVLLKLPLTQKSGRFVITNVGDYALWQSGRTIQRVLVKMTTPAITDLRTGQQIMVHPTFSTVRINNGWEGRIQLFTFWAEAGQYELELTTNLVAFASESPYFLEIREQKPGYLLVSGILLLLVAAACLIAGMVLPVNADNIFT